MFETIVWATDGSAVHARSHKPGHAWQRFVDATAADVPAPLVGVVERVLALARA